MFALLGCWYSWDADAVGCWWCWDAGAMGYWYSWDASVAVTQWDAGAVGMLLQLECW